MIGDTSERLRQRLMTAESRLEALEMLGAAEQHGTRLNQARQEVLYLRRLLEYSESAPKDRLPAIDDRR
ncbi:hypothetical protein DLJ53_17810 [Acuticoccus sediminis]|uniref:Uncharacterized protein n=1 Tax=Acuticoccus sediminis TaxID=2184697 RepID=A0A8B2NQW5_9HYPH|nr:hypothetical protein [Acuticoccus sediminis]RAI01072.1 hypothetical protein DLJ53_17810 [Acuticoccus sediminis]